MSYSGIPHHKVVIQNLYSTKANWNKALRHGYTIAQARSDVFFTLLFGGQVCLSAGAFFDSPIAIRVFGELCSHPEFEKTCRDYGWRRLRLNTDGHPISDVGISVSPSPIDFVTARWRDPKMSFTFFREFESGFDDPEEMRVIKDAASSAPEREEYGGLADQLSPLFKDHQIKLDDPAEDFDYQSRSITEEALGAWSAHAPGLATTPAILTQDAGKWIGSLIGYLLTYKALENRDSAKRPDILDQFFPMKAVIERTKGVEASSKLYSKEELGELNKDFIRKFGNPRTMNPIHNAAPAHYLHYYPLIDHWAETEWHALRQRIYGAETCILSSDWHLRDVFDFDHNSQATYAKDVRIDASLRFAQEEFGEINWDILFATITDSKWRSLLILMRAEADPDRRRRHADAILNLLASKFSEFQFDNDHGFVSVNVKRVSRLGYLTAYADIAAKYHHTLEGLLGTNLASFVVAAAAPTGFAGSKAKVIEPTLRPMLKGAKYLFTAYKGRELRRAIVPDIYGA